MVVKVKPYIQNEDYNNEIVLHVRLMLTGDMVAFFFFFCHNNRNTNG